MAKRKVTRVETHDVGISFNIRADKKEVTKIIERLMMVVSKFDVSYMAVKDESEVEFIGEMDEEIVEDDDFSDSENEKGLDI